MCGLVYLAAVRLGAQLGDLVGEALTRPLGDGCRRPLP